MAERTILAVDDDRTVHKFVSLVLGERGFHVETVGDGLQALTWLSHNTPDLILLDFVMPRMNGFQLLNTLDSKHLVPDTPVVLMSSLAAKVGERLLRMTRVRECIEKPFTAEDLVDVVERYIGGGPRRLTAILKPPTGLEPDATQIRTGWTELAQMREMIQSTLAEGFADRAGDLLAAKEVPQLLLVLAEILEVRLDEDFLEALAAVAGS